MKKYLLLITLLYLPLATRCMDSREIANGTNNNRVTSNCLLDIFYLGLFVASGCAIRTASISLTDPHAELYDLAEGMIFQAGGLGGIGASVHRLTNRGYFDLSCLNYCINRLDDSHDE